MKGVPLRIEIGPKDIAMDKIVLVRRVDQKKTDLMSEKLVQGVESVLNDIQQSMFEKTKSFLKEKTKSVSDFDIFKSELEKEMFLSSPWCGDQKCEEKIKNLTGADIRLIPFDNDKVRSKCINCKRPSKENVIFARGY
jgi:Prolyl-tRNA synthetase